MWLTVLFAVINAILSFLAVNFLRLSALDISMAAAMIVAWNKGPILLSAVIFIIAYCIPNPKELTYIWLTIPLTILVGFLALITENVLLLVLIYHSLSLIGAIFLGYFNPKYVSFMCVNFSINYLVAKAYLFLF